MEGSAASVMKLPNPNLEIYVYEIPKINRYYANIKDKILIFKDRIFAKRKI
jgi:hypothetical protein